MGVLFARLVMALLIAGVLLLIGALVYYGYNYLRRQSSGHE